MKKRIGSLGIQIQPQLKQGLKDSLASACQGESGRACFLKGQNRPLQAGVIPPCQTLPEEADEVGTTEKHPGLTQEHDGNSVSLALMAPGQNHSTVGMPLNVYFLCGLGRCTPIKPEISY